MKKLIAILPLVSIMSFPLLSAAQSTNVDSKSLTKTSKKKLDSVAKRVLEQGLEKEDHPWKRVYKDGQDVRILQGGTDIGGGVDSNDELFSWCQDQVAFMRRIVRNSKLVLENTGLEKINKVNHMLARGIKQAWLRERESELPSYFTRLSLERGMELVKVLGILKDSEKGTAELTNYNSILFEYYNFVIKDVAGSLDIPYAVRNIGDYKTQGFERTYIEYVKRELTFAERFLDEKDGTVTSSLLASVYLKLMKSLVKFAIQDLNDSPYRLRFSCAIQGLLDLRDDIQNFNRGSRDLFVDVKQLMEVTTVELKNISNSLDLSDSCQRAY